MSAAGTTAQQAGQTAVEVGRVFGNGGTDGLILYALILATFLMFLALIVVTVLLTRALAKANENCQAQSKFFSDASGEVADSLRELATSISAKGASDGAHQLSVAQMLGRLEVQFTRGPT